jgi:hypothetical protein
VSEEENRAASYVSNSRRLQTEIIKGENCVGKNIFSNNQKYLFAFLSLRFHYDVNAVKRNDRERLKTKLKMRFFTTKKMNENARSLKREKQQSNFDQKKTCGGSSKE